MVLRHAEVVSSFDPTFHGDIKRIDKDEVVLGFQKQDKVTCWSKTEGKDLPFARRNYASREGGPLFKGCGAEQFSFQRIIEELMIKR